MLLLLGVFLFSFVALLLGLEVYRIHKTIRSKIPPLEKQIASLEEENEALKKGGDAAMVVRIFGEPPFNAEAEGRMPALGVWTRRLQEIERERGAVWRGVTPSGQVDPATGRVPVTIPNPPHGLAKDTLVFAFEQGEPNAADPQQGSQYLGEFRVVDVRPDGATLEAVIRLDNRTGNRLVASRQPWSLYETMPGDSHELFAGLEADKLHELLPASTVDEYIRHGQPATPDDDEFHRAGFDEQGQRLGPDDAAKAVKWLYDRPLRDYAWLFAAAHREFVELAAQRTALTEDTKKLDAAKAIAEKLTAMRVEEQQGLSEDLTHMKADRAAIESLLAAVQAKLAEMQKQSTRKQAENVRMAGQLREEQLRALRRARPASSRATAGFTGVP